MTRGPAARTRVIAHRGASGSLPENSLPPCARALEQRADMIAVDLHRTRDGAVGHDASLEGLGVRGEVANTPLEKISRLDAGDGTRVPRLSEVLEAFGAPIDFPLEIENALGGAYPALEAQVLGEVETRGLLEGDSLLLLLG